MLNPLAPTPPQAEPYRDPCVPSPCGLYATCRNQQDQAVCACQPNYFGTPPHCRPECTINADCPTQLACINERCGDPCAGACGQNTECRVINHTPNCVCLQGYVGDAFVACRPAPRKLEEERGALVKSEIKHLHHSVAPPAYEEPRDPCNPSPCGNNAICSGDGQCTCLAEYQGDPYVSCRPECVLSSECPRNRACVNQKCVDPCPGTCGASAICEVINHIAMCHCPEGMTGNAFIHCSPVQSRFHHRDPRLPQSNLVSNPLVEVYQNPCQPSPCGANAECRERQGQAICSCLTNYYGVPPACRPECTTNYDCAPDRACQNQRCVDPCPGACGGFAECRAISHSAHCSCRSGYTGNPFLQCHIISKSWPNLKLNHGTDSPLSSVEPQRDIVPRDPCQPSPCGPNSQCRSLGDTPSCSCLENFFGTPPNCRPECLSNSDCALSLICLNNRCKDPCPGLCGSNAECRVLSHSAMCYCQSGYSGDPFVLCSPIQREPPEIVQPCNPNPCGTYAECREQNGVGSCQCLPEYFGNPYEACRPECVLDSDCASNRACLNQKCRDPCPGSCGQNAECFVRNHLPTCNCLPNYVGDPYRYCHIEEKRKETKGISWRKPNTESSSVLLAMREYVNPCQPSPCGPNSQCKELNEQAVCSCLPEYIGQPPGCRPECTLSSECSFDKACVNQKCVDPCPGACGSNAVCHVTNHAPLCACQTGYTGDPFTGCYPTPRKLQSPFSPCLFVDSFDHS